MELPQLDNYQQLFIDDIPLIDVRAPVEFEQGAFPCAQNLPLMSDEERHQIGLRYKHKGQNAAIDLGHELIQGEVKDTRVAQWLGFTEQYPQGALYCFRGGLRSKISQQWIYETSGIMYPRIKGGYKALRRFLLEQLDHACTALQPVVLGGRTGTGKTLFLRNLQQQIDLEKIFHHRGSAFGKHATAQPSQIDVENRLAIDLLKLRHQQVRHIVLEDEAANIGSRQIPLNLFKVMQQAPIVLLEIDLPERIDNVFAEYVTGLMREYRTLYGDVTGTEKWIEHMQTANDKIQRRLGGQRHKKISALLADAIDQHRRNNDTTSYKDWIKRLLTDYYDPMYDYQLEKKQERIICRGDHASLPDYLTHHFGVR